MSFAVDQSPAVGAVAIDVSVSDYEPAFPIRGLSIGTAGALKVTMVNGDVVVIPANCLAIGIQHAIACKKIWSAGTGASEIVIWK